MLKHFEILRCRRAVALVVSILSGLALLESGMTPGIALASDAQQFIMASLGDSITAGTFADRPLRSGSGIGSTMFIENKDFLSWASGTKVGSHYLRLKQFLLAQDESVKLEIMNVAVPATTTYDLERQATRVLRKMRSGRYDALKYVTILVGANDVCSRDNPSGIPVEVMRSNLLKAIDVLAQVSQAEPVRVLVVGIPKIPDLAQPGIRDAKTTLGLSCHRVRDQMLALCNNLLSWRTPEEYRKQLSIVEETNRMLEQTVHEGNAKYPNVQMAYTGRLFEQVIPLEDLAIDCFHPNAKAHDKIAQDTWLDQPWFR